MDPDEVLEALEGLANSPTNWANSFWLPLAATIIGVALGGFIALLANKRLADRREEHEREMREEAWQWEREQRTEELRRDRLARYVEKIAGEAIPPMHRLSARIRVRSELLEEKARVSPQSEVPSRFVEDFDMEREEFISLAYSVGVYAAIAGPPLAERGGLVANRLMSVVSPMSEALHEGDTAGLGVLCRRLGPAEETGDTIMAELLGFQGSIIELLNPPKEE